MDLTAWIIYLNFPLTISIFPFYGYYQSNIEVKNHIVVMPDASVDAALDAVVESGFGASGNQRFMGPCVAVFVGSSTEWCNFCFKF